MKKYKREFFQEYFKPVLNYRGHTIADIEHSVSRYKERVGKDIFVYERLLKKAINWIYDNHKEQIEDRYIFRSKKYKFGIQLEWRRDRYNKNLLNGFTATTLSENEMKYYTKKDKEIFVESFIKEGHSKKFSERIFDKGYSTFKIPFDTMGYDMFCEAGEVFYTFNLVELED